VAVKNKPSMQMDNTTPRFPDSHNGLMMVQGPRNANTGVWYHYQQSLQGTAGSQPA
jgi:hypothetical protein